MTIPTWEGDRAQRALAQVRAHGTQTNAPCALCLKPIDYHLRYPHPDSLSVDHKHPRKTHPHLTWDPNNWQPSHLRCNTPTAHTGEPQLGPTSWD